MGCRRLPRIALTPRTAQGRGWRKLSLLLRLVEASNRIAPRSVPGAGRSAFNAYSNEAPVGAREAAQSDTMSGIAPEFGKPHIASLI